MAKWQPIETAPKDGTLVDLWLPGLPNPAFPDALTTCPAGRETNCRWQDGRWWGSDYMQSATHWMPLPLPPVSSQESSDAHGDRS